MPQWIIAVSVKDFWRDDSKSISEKAALFAGRIRSTRWRDITPYPDYFDQLVDDVEAAEDVDEFDARYDELCDLADEDRVWIETR